MKITLEFDGIEEKQDARIALDAGAFYSICFDFRNKLYRFNKHDEVIPQEHLDKIIALWEECGGNEVEY